MVTKNKKSDADETKGRVKVDKLKLNKETVRDLTGDEAKNVKGGYPPGTQCTGDISGCASRGCKL